ncbi:Mrp/NBP35 family ATP-binding protein [Niabella defluvii]|nr:Mrp/NBP35 family ATP-binding protein [Niabella sp. I65]
MFGQAQLNARILGLVENMSYFTPAELPGNKYYIFGKQGAQKLAEQYELPFLGEIPLVQSIREGGDIGVPVMVSDDEVSKKAFRSWPEKWKVAPETAAAFNPPLLSTDFSILLLQKVADRLQYWASRVLSGS